MKLVSAAVMRELDRRTMEEYDVPGVVLMERAGLGVADAVQNLAMLSARAEPFVRLVAGHGNNGGDAFAAARLLHEWGGEVELILATPRHKIQGDARSHFERMAGVRFVNEAPGLP